MTDRFENRAQSLQAPASDGFEIVPNDSLDLVENSRAIYVGTGGAVSLVMASGSAVVLKNVAAGSLLPLRVKSIKATGTSAADIVGLV